VGILGTSSVGISLNSISKLISRGRNWLRLSISWCWPVSRSWNRNNNWSWVHNCNWLITDKDWSRDRSSYWQRNSRGNNWGTTDERERLSYSDKFLSMSVVMACRSISDNCNCQTEKNDECLK
jgi:hypothetical protein